MNLNLNWNHYYNSKKRIRDIIKIYKKVNNTNFYIHKKNDFL